MTKVISEDGIIAILKKMIEKEGSQKQVAAILGINDVLLSQVLHGARSVGTRIPLLLGYEPVVVYVERVSQPSLEQPYEDGRKRRRKSA